MNIMANDFKSKIKRTCLVCDHVGTTYETKKEHKDIIPCPKCKGSFVDVWEKEKYASDIKEIEGITINIDARKANPPLLTIELENESSVPKVFYKGEEVKHKANILFDWDTSDGRSPGGMTYAIDHYEEGKGQLVRNRIERSFRDHA